MQKENSEIQDFTAFFKKYNSQFVRFATSYLRNKAVAEDIVMESFLYYWENRSSLNVDLNIPPYILTTIKNKCLNYLRSEITHRRIENRLKEYQEILIKEEIESLEACDPQYLFSEEIQGIIKEVLANLPKQTREIFIKSRFDFLSHKEIAIEMGLSTKSVEAHISKALKGLRYALRDYIHLFLFYL